MSSANNNHGLPLISLENPEVVKLRIAKEHLDSLFALKKCHLDEVCSTFSQLITEIEAAEPEDSTSHSLRDERRLNWITLHTKYRKLFKFGEEMGVFGKEVRETYHASRGPQSFKRCTAKKHGDKVMYNDQPRWVDEISHEHQSDRLELLTEVVTKVAKWKKQQITELEEEIKKFML